MHKDNANSKLMSSKLNILLKIYTKFNYILFSKIYNKISNYLEFNKNYFKFSSIIEILEPGSDQSSFHGKIIQGSAFKATKQEKKTEISVLICTIIFTVILLYITSPLGSKFQGVGLWGDWWQENLQRVSTAAIVTMLVSSINLVFHWLSIKKEYPIRWVAEDLNE